MKQSTLPIRRALSKMDGTKPPRVFEVYEDKADQWRWRLWATGNWKIISSAEDFYGKGHAKAAANRECGYMRPGLAVVVVTE